MGNYSLIIVLAGALGLFSLIRSSRVSTQATDHRLSDHTYKVVSRESAITGLNMTLRRLDADTSSWAVNPASYEFVDEPYRHSTFTTDVQANYSGGWLNGNCWVDTVDVISTATSEGHMVDATASLQPRTHRIEATYVRSCSDDTSGGPADFFGYPIVADKDMKLENNISVMSRDPSENVDIHSNGKMRIEGSPTIQGYGTYATSGGSCGGGCTGFQPNDDINGSDPNYFAASEVDISSFDPEDYRADAAYVDGDVIFQSSAATVDFADFNGVTGYGTADDPYLWFIDGNLTFNADVTFQGYGIIVITGYVTINSNVEIYSGLPLGVTPPPSSGDNPNTDATRTFLDTYLTDGPTVGLYIGGYVETGGDKVSLVTSGTSTIFGTIFANESILIPGDMAIYGSVAAVGNVVMSGKTVVWYETGHESILLPLGAGSGAPMPEGLRLLSYVEW